MATKKKEPIAVEIKPLETETFRVKIIGDTPLIVHNWDEKNKRMMLEAQMGKPKSKSKPKRNPVDDFINSLVWLSHKPECTAEDDPDDCMRAFEEACAAGATFGFPATGLKKAACTGTMRAGFVKNKVGLKGAMYIEPNVGEYLIIHSDEPPTMREDTVKIGGITKTSDLRYRAEFKNWWMEFNVKITTCFGFTIGDIVNAINIGGMVCGIGEWRVERDGQFGMYHVSTGDE